MLQCKDITPMVDRYGTLTLAEIGAIVNHLRHCKPCAEIAEEREAKERAGLTEAEIEAAVLIGRADGLCVWLDPEGGFH